MKKTWSILLVENMCTVESKETWKHWRLKAAMRVAFKFNGPNKLKKINFTNIAAMKITAVFECNGTNSSAAGTNLDTIRFYQKI